VREVIVRLVLVVAGLLLGLAAIEGGLQVAALVAPALFARAWVGHDGGGLRIACVGDSHVYGAFVPPGAAFPEQLDRILHRRGVSARVYNFGVPGQNSFQVRERLPRILARVRPQIVFVLVGHNNYWNLSERGVDAPAAPVSWAWRDLRLVRLLHVLRMSVREGSAAARRPDLRLVDQTASGEHLLLDLGDGVERIDMWRGGHELAPEEVERVTAGDLHAIVALVRGAGATPILLGYPVVLRPERAAVQRALARVAVDEQVLCLDTEPVTKRLQRRRIANLFFADLHPTAPWYRAMAWALSRQLVRRGLVSDGAAPHIAVNSTPSGCSPIVERP